MTLAYGIDVSQNQPKVDWPTVKEAGSLSFMIARASLANWQDPVFAQHWAGAKAAGIRRGAYHFLTEATDPLQQLSTYLRALGNDPGELPPVVDIEANITDPAKYDAMAQVWLHEAEKKLGRRPIIYTGGWWWDPHMFISGRYPDWAPGYGLWVASYPMKADVPAKAQIDGGQLTAILPKSWTSWLFWQYSGDVAFLDGITDNNGRQAHVDLDVFNGSADDLAALAPGAMTATATDKGVATAASTGTATIVSLKLPDPRVTNQILINAFSHAFGPDYWQVVQRAGLAGIADQRQAEYAGPDVTALANLTDVEQGVLRQQLANIVGAS